MACSCVVSWYHNNLTNVDFHTMCTAEWNIIPNLIIIRGHKTDASGVNFNDQNKFDRLIRDSSNISFLCFLKLISVSLFVLGHWPCTFQFYSLCLQTLMCTRYSLNWFPVWLFSPSGYLYSNLTKFNPSCDQEKELYCSREHYHFHYWREGW